MNNVSESSSNNLKGILHDKQGYQSIPGLFATIYPHSTSSAYCYTRPSPSKVTIDGARAIGAINYISRTIIVNRSV